MKWKTKLPNTENKRTNKSKRKEIRLKRLKYWIMKEQYRLKQKIGRLRVREWNKNISKEKEMKMEI